MGKEKINQEDMEFIKVIPGFTKLMQQELKKRAKTKDKITLDNVTNMPTYAFAMLALENNAPLQLVSAMKMIKKRYFLKSNVSKETVGFFDDLQGKAYGYIAINIKNIEQRENFYKLAEASFKKASSNGYHDAHLDMADLKKIFESRDDAEEEALEAYDDTKDVIAKMGEIYYGFPQLVESAVRVLEKKRPLIEDISDFAYAYHKYDQGKEVSLLCRFYYGLALIIRGHEEPRCIEEGLKIVNSNFKEMETRCSEDYKKMFGSDAKVIKDNMKLIKTRIIDNTKR